jgi:histidyl-tRNA synthetase
MACNFFKSLNLTPSDIVVKISDRNLLNQKLAALKIKPNQKSAVIGAIDKKDRIENLEYQKLLKTASLTNNQITKLEDFLNQSGKNSQSEWLITLFDCLKNYKVENYCQFDPKIVRGLDYYTSTVFEAFDRKNQFRAILAGGRYDNLISSVGGPDLPGVGFGLGDAVILLLLESLNKLPKLNPCPTQILVTLFDQNFLAKTLEIVTILRENEINCELYPEAVKLDKQLKYANSNNIPFVLIIGPDEFKQNLATIKDMQTGEQKTVRVEEIINQIKN